MRIFLVPFIAYALAPAGQSAEPNERAMKLAFEARLEAQVQNVLDYVRETYGPEGVARIRAAGTDRFEVREFKKLECVREDDGYVCNFSVDVSVATGSIAQTIRGRFVLNADQTLTFIQDI